MSREEIFEQLKEILIFADQKNRDIVESCNEDTKIVTELGFNSVSVLYMVIAIEEKFGIVFGDVKVNDFQTIGDVITFISEKLN